MSGSECRDHRHVGKFASQPATHVRLHDPKVWTALGLVRISPNKLGTGRTRGIIATSSG